MMRAAGSDAVTEIYGDKGAVAQEIIDAKRAELGLDKPFLTQYLAWVGGMMTGNMGTSYISGKDVFQTFVSKLPFGSAGGGPARPVYRLFPPVFQLCGKFPAEFLCGAASHAGAGNPLEAAARDF